MYGNARGNFNVHSFLICFPCDTVVFSFCPCIAVILLPMIDSLSGLLWIMVKKNVPRHILAPRRGCFGNHLPLRRVRILAERFCMIGRNFLSYKKRIRNCPDSFLCTAYSSSSSSATMAPMVPNILVTTATTTNNTSSRIQPRKIMISICKRLPFFILPSCTMLLK